MREVIKKWKKIILISTLLIGILLTTIVLGYPVRDYIFREQQLKDLNTKGGVEITLQFDMTNIPKAERSNVFNESKDILIRRIKFFGLYPFMKDSSDYTVVTQLANVSNLDLLANLIGTTARLSFWEEVASPSAKTPTTSTSQPVLKRTNLSGADIQQASVTFNSNTGNPQVSLVFTTDGAKKFADITKRNVGKPLAIVLDNQTIENPIIEEAIVSGDAVISGNLTKEQAENLSTQINAGALSVPVTILEKHYIQAVNGK